MKKSEINFNDVKMGELVDIDAKVKELLDNKQYEEVIHLMDMTLEEERTSAYYFYRAYARNKISKNWVQNFKLILEDLNQAIAIDNDEDSLNLRFDVLDHYLSNKSQEDHYRYIKDINEQGEYEYYDDDEIPPNPEQPELDRFGSMMDETINTLIKKYPKAEYYVKKYDYYRDNRRENIEKACQLEPNPHIYLRRVDFEIVEGHIDIAKEYISKIVELSNDPEVLFNIVTRLVRLGDNEEACKIIHQLVPFKTDKGTPFLLETQYGTPFITSRIDILLEMSEFSDYAQILYLYYLEDPGMDVSLICNLLHHRQFEVVLQYFDCSGLDNQTLQWINGWAYFGLGNENKAKEILINLDGKKLSLECMVIGRDIDDYCDITKVSDLAKSELFSYRFESQADALFSVVPFEDIDPDSFLDLILSLFRPETSQTWRWRNKPIIRERCELDGNGSPFKHDFFQSALQKIIQDMSRMDKEKSPALKELSKTSVEQKLVDIVILTMLKNRFELALSKYIIMENDKIKNEAKDAERIRIISNLSHSIKNLVRSVINPLHNLRQELPEKINTIDLALRAANLIREMVNAINASQSINIQNFIWDAQHPDGESLTLKEIVHACLVYSIGNMFDFKYFNVFSANYFPRSLGISERGLVQQQWELVSVSGNLDQVLEFTKQHLFKCSIQLGSIADLRIGNAKSSMVNLTILFQEIIFNAIKFSSFVPLEQRFVSIKLTQKHDQIRLDVSNSCDPENIARSTGQGMGIIKDFAKGLNCIPVINRTDTTYSITIEFNNLWRNDVKDSIH